MRWEGVKQIDGGFSITGMYLLGLINLWVVSVG